MVIQFTSVGKWHTDLYFTWMYEARTLDCVPVLCANVRYGLLMIFFQIDGISGHQSLATNRWARLPHIRVVKSSSFRFGEISHLRSMTTPRRNYFRLCFYRKFRYRRFKCKSIIISSERIHFKFVYWDHLVHEMCPATCRTNCLMHWMWVREIDRDR